MRYIFRKNIVLILIIITILLALLISLFQSANTNRPAYIDSENSNSISAIPEKSAEDYDLITYFEEKENYTIYVPQGWKKAIQEGHPVFVNPTDGSTLSIELIDYSPQISNLTEEKLSQELSAKGGEIITFQRNGNTSYQMIYVLSGYVYMTYSEWSYDKTFSVLAILQESVYDTYKESIAYIFSHISWEKTNPVPENFLLYYNAFGNFEFGVPSGWDMVIENGSLYLTDSETSATIGVSVVETAATFEGVSQITFANVMGQGKSGFILRNFINTGTIIQAEASYTQNGEPWVMVEKILCNGTYQYTFALACPASAYTDIGGYFETATSLFRTFS